MKQKLLLLSVLFIIASCNKNEEQQEIFRLDPNAKVYVKPDVNSVKFDYAKSSVEHLTPLEVVKQADVLNFYNNLISDTYCTATWVGKDTISETPALLRWGTDIIYDTDGYGHYGLQTDFIYGYDMVICREYRSNSITMYDTLAYIPNSVIINARNAIQEALESRDTAAVYGIFKDAFKFIPITGEEWRELKKQGLN